MKKTAIYQRKRPDSPRWLNKWIQSLPWFFGFVLAVFGCLVIFVVNATTGRIHPGNAWGLGYGIGATVALVAVLLYTVRRRTMKLRPPGRAWTYLQVHVYGGGIFLLLMLMHTGFRIPSGIHTWWLWLISLWVVGSGVLGIVIQKWIPTVLSAGLAVEVHYDRVPELIEHIRTRSEKIVASADERLREFYESRVAPSLVAPEPRLMYFIDITGGIHARIKPFEYLRALLPASDQESLDELKELFNTKLEIDAHYTLQRVLRTWLILHVPISMVLVVLLFIHIFSVLYY
ncbi:MAG: hypothetical protein IH951_09750 [Bacteroidetes bacterium]|nr:hypothetical protein [Bacteroidota bacterium]